MENYFENVAGLEGANEEIQEIAVIPIFELSILDLKYI